MFPLRTMRSASNTSPLRPTTENCRILSVSWNQIRLMREVMLVCLSAVYLTRSDSSSQTGTASSETAPAMSTGTIMALSVAATMRIFESPDDWLMTSSEDRWRSARPMTLAVSAMNGRNCTKSRGSFRAHTSAMVSMV